MFTLSIIGLGHLVQQLFQIVWWASVIPWCFVLLLGVVVFVLFRRSRNLARQLTNSRFRYDKVVNENLGLMYIHDLDGNIQFVNQACIETLGYSYEALLGMNIRQLKCRGIQCPDDLDFDRYLHEIQTTHIQLGLIAIQNRTGQEKILYFKNMLVHEDATAHILGLAQDVTQIWAAERQRDEMQERTDLIISTIPDTIVQIDREGTIIFLNRALPGLPPGNYLGKNLREIFTGNLLLQRRQLLKHVLKNQELVESRLVLGDHTFQSRIVPLKKQRVHDALVILTDITEKLQQEERLDNALIQLKALTDTIPGVLYRVDIRECFPGKVIFVNSKILELTGYPAEDFLEARRSWFDLVLEEDLQRVMDFVRNNGSTVPHFVEYRIRCSRGNIRWLLNYASTSFQENQPRFRDGVILEITDLKEKEFKINTLNKELEEFKYAINEASIVSITDLRGTIKYVNNKFCEVSKYSRDELIGRNHHIVNSGYHPPSFWNELWKKITQGDIWRGELRNRAKDGSLYWVDTFIIPIRNVSGRVVEYLSIRNEITQKKMQEEELKLLSMVASQTSNFVIITNPRGHIEWVNESFERFTGYQLHEIQGLKPGSFLQRDDTPAETRSMMTSKIEHEEAFSSEVLNYTRHGEPYWVQINAQPIRDYSGKVVKYFAIMRNITEQKTLITHLEQALAQAREAEQLKSSFLANISHEIRTPMNAILGFSELLEKKELSESKRHNFLKLIRERSYDLLTVVNDILDMSKIEAGQISSVDVTGNLAELFERLLLMFDAEAYHLRNKSVRIHVNNELKGSENIMMADFIRLNQVLINLLTNAAKFTQDGFIRLSCRKKGLHTLLFSVEDTGIGIPRDKFEVIFKPFRQANQHIHQTFGGSGLGLAICKGLVNMWGGEIWVESEGSGKGSIFFFTMPYRRSTP